MSKISTKSYPGLIGDTAELTHGTLETRNLNDSRRMFEDILGLRCVRHSPVSQLLAGRGGVGIVCVEAPSVAHPRGEENRWVILVVTPKAVEKVHRTAGDSGMLMELREISHEGNTAHFIMQDRDANWWEISSLSPSHYQSIFERGDLAIP
jgi:catechol 2,3-dioxygenase-like lactoylglutathione lyase family enzyme